MENIEEYRVGDVVWVRGVEWSCDGLPLRKVNSPGVVVSLLGDTGHASRFKYRIKLRTVVFGTDNLHGEIIMKSKLNINQK